MSERIGFRLADLDPELEQLATKVVDAAFCVRRELGVGLLEEMYRLALLYELTDRGIPARTRVPLSVTYKGHPLGKGYEADILVGDAIVLELKATDAIHPVHEAQLMTYMRLVRAPLGFVVNFNQVPFAAGIRRRVFSEFASSRLRGQIQEAN